jgi:dihydroxyacetone kinase-like predicted kinase
VIVLPNNSNVQLTAEQAAQLIMTGREPRQAVYVLPTRSIPQGIAAMLGYTPDGETEEVLAAMRERIGAVRTGEVTRATRALVWEGLDVKAGQTIGLIDDQLALVAETPEEAVSLLLFAMQADQHEVVTIFYGDGVRAQDAEALAELLAGQFPRQQIEVLWGGQPYYPFIIGVE